MRTIYFDRNSKVVRFFLWCWDVTPEDLSFCTMFWGYIFSPVAIIFGHGLGRSIYGWAELIKACRDKFAIEGEPEPEPEDLGPSALGRALERITLFFQRNAKVFEVIFGALGICVVVIGIGFAVYGVIYSLINWPMQIAIGTVYLLALMVVIVIAAFIFHVFFTSFIPSKIKKFFTCIGRNLKFFANFMLEGERAFKTRTCPKIVIINNESNHYHGEGLSPEHQYILRGE